MHQIEIRPGQELFRRVTEDFFPRWIRPLQATVEARDAEQVAGKGEKPIELRLDAPALNHNANLTRHGRNESNEPLVFRLRFASKKFNDRHDLIGRQDGHGQARFQSGFLSEARSRKIVVLSDVRDPPHLPPKPREEHRKTTERPRAPHVGRFSPQSGGGSERGPG